MLHICIAQLAGHIWVGYSHKKTLIPALSDPPGWKCSSDGISRSFPSRGIGSAAS